MLAAAAASRQPHFALADADYGVTASASATANARNLQRAVNDRRVVLLPGSSDPIEISDPIVVPPGTQIIGAGAGRTVIRALGAQAFSFRAPNGTAMLEGPKLADFTLQCANVGLALNSRQGGFTDDSSSQCYIMRPRLERMRLIGPGADTPGTAGVDWNLVFSGVFDQCEIVGFETGIRTLGCDFTAVMNRTRIWNCGTLIDCERTGYFGSGMLIDGADLLIPTRRFLRSSDHHLIVRNTYFEKQNGRPLPGPVLDLAHSYMTLFTGNRFETPRPECPMFLTVEGEGALFLFEHNSYGGPGWGEVSWNRDNSARYMLNASIRQKIVIRNNRQNLVVPFNTTEGEAVRNERRDLWIIAPGSEGFVGAFNYAERCRVQDGAFVLPAARRYGSLVRFKDPQRPVSGPVSVHVLARSDIEGTEMTVNAMSGEIAGSAVRIGLSRDYQWRTAYERVEREDLALDMFNDDVQRGGRSFVKMVVVERA
jgi:hypothetical protein